MGRRRVNRVDKSWVLGQLRYAAKLKSLAEMKVYQERLLKALDDGEATTNTVTSTVRDLSFDQVIEIFDLNPRLRGWEYQGKTRKVPHYLISELARIEEAPYDKNSEQYNRMPINSLITACSLEYKRMLSARPKPNKLNYSTEIPVGKPIATVSEPNHSTDTAGPSYIAPVTPGTTLRGTSQPLQIKVFHEMSLSVQVEKGGKVWVISGIADWAMGYGDRTALEDGAVLMAVEAKRPGCLSSAEPQLLAYLATIRQLRIQAGKRNVMTQGFYSDGQCYRFVCIRNDGTVMKSMMYDLSVDDGEAIEPVFNFLFGILSTAADNSPNTSLTKAGSERDEEIENFDRAVFAKVFKVPKEGEISAPIIYHDETDDGGELSDVYL